MARLRSGPAARPRRRAAVALALALLCAAVALAGSAPDPASAAARETAASPLQLNLEIARRGPKVGRPCPVAIRLLNEGRVNVDLDRIEASGRAVTLTALANIRLRAGQRAYRFIGTDLRAGRYRLEARAVTFDGGLARATIPFTVRSDGSVALTGGATSSGSRRRASALATVDLHETFTGDRGRTYQFTIENVSAAGRIRAVEILRPSAGFRITSCPRAPPGWTGEASATACRFRSDRDDPASYIAARRAATSRSARRSPASPGTRSRSGAAPAAA